MKWTEDVRPNKGVIRKSVTAKREQVYQRYACLPGEDCCCIKEAFNNGAIDKDTKIFAVEKNKAVSESIQKSLQQEGFRNVEICKGDIVKFNFSDLDAAYFDLCGVFKRDLAEWLFNGKYFFKDNSYAFFTHSIPYRHWERNSFIKSLEADRYGLQDDGDFGEILYNKFVINEPRESDLRITRPAKESGQEDKRGGNGTYYSFEFAQRYGLYGCLFANYNIEQFSLWRYQDVMNPMFTVGFKILRRNEKLEYKDWFFKKYLEEKKLGDEERREVKSRLEPIIAK